jgi:glycosyltransferase involved in cell wall biosynthesis
MELIILVIGVLSTKSFSGQIPFIVELVKTLLAKDCKVTMVTSKAGETLFRGLGLDIDYRLIDSREGNRQPGLARIPFIMIKRMFRAGILLRKMNLNRSTVVYANCNLLWELFPLLFVRKETVIRVATFIMGYPSPFRGYRGAFTGRLKMPGLRETLAYIQYRLGLPCLKHASDLVLAYPHMRDFLTGQGIPAEKLVRLEVGVRWNVLNTAAPSEKRYAACWIGRYNPQKGCEDLISIWETVAGTMKDARLAVMGDVARELEPLSRKKIPGNNIEFLGPVNDETKYSVMKGSRVFLFPSYYEAWPQTAQEAMACGLPVVAYDLPVYRHIFPGGIVRVPIGDKQALAREVIGILDDRDRRERLGAEAFGIASQYRWETAAERLLAAAEQVMNQSLTA